MQFMIASGRIFYYESMPSIAQKNFRLSRIGHWSFFSDVLLQQTGSKYLKLKNKNRNRYCYRYGKSIVRRQSAVHDHGD